MRIPLVLGSALLLTVCPAQTGHERVNATIAALQQAPTDAVKDSLSAVLKADLRAVLEADDAFTADLRDLRISRVDAPDGRFRLITWNIPYADGHHGYEGLLLVQDKKRRVLYELRDMTPRIASPGNVELASDNWYGALYYEVVATNNGGKQYYTLLGWKGYSNVETRKVIEVLSFKGGTPRFGAPLFGEGRARHHREVFGYSFQVSMSLRWDPAGKRIVLDHLSPMRDDMQGQAAFLGPDLSYDAYVWDKGRWRFERDIDARDLDLSKPWNPPPRVR